MADNGLLVTISGAALSLLFYENACSVGDQMGFLLGDVVMYVTKNVTDSERHEEFVRRHIDITSILTCPSAGSLYDPTGKLYKEALKNCVRERSKEIVGWFRFRHNNRLVPTFRDKILHKELAAYFHECNANTSKELFLACILNASTSEKQGTHKFKHVLLRYENGLYHPVPLRINNLGGGTDRQDTSDYIPTPARTHDREPDVFTKFVRSLNLDLDHKSDSELVMTIQRATECHLESLIPILCESDREVYTLEKQVREIRSNVIHQVLSPTAFKTENQRTNESNRRMSMSMEGEQCVKMEIKHESPPRTPNLYEDSMEGEQSVKMEIKHESPPRTPNLCEDSFNVNKYSSVTKNKTAGKSQNAINTSARRNPSNSVQKSPSDKTSYSQVMKNSVDTGEDMIKTADC